MTPSTTFCENSQHSRPLLFQTFCMNSTCLRRVGLLVCGTLLSFAWSAPQSIEAGELRYTGQLEQVERNGNRIPVKDFEVTCHTNPAEPGYAFFLVQESRPALPWVERYGVVEHATPLLDAASVAIGYRHLDRNYVLPVGLPYFADFEQLGLGASWKNERGEFEVVGIKTVNGQRCWEVRATTGVARHHQFFVRQSEPIIESASQTVFMGPGDRFKLNFSLQEQTSAERENPEQFAATTRLLLKMKQMLDRPVHDRFQALTSEQTQPLNELREKLFESAELTALKSFAKEVNEQLLTLANRQTRVDDLAGNMLQQTAPRFTLSTLDEKALNSTDYAGKTVVLHFWDYTNETLEQPYGQVGYLDFLANRWKDRNVVVLGVAVNSQLNDPATRAKSIRAIRHLRQFMRLSYDVVFDPGAALNSFGNPTRLGEDLPLWIVIGPDGKVAHYKTGFYEVDNRVGLTALNTILTEQAEKE